jgi:hypothetical protein
MEKTEPKKEDNKTLQEKPDFEKLALEFSNQYWGTDRTVYELFKMMLPKVWDTYVTPLNSELLKLREVEDCNKRTILNLREEKAELRDMHNRVLEDKENEIERWKDAYLGLTKL